MSSVEYDNAVYAEISLETKGKVENEYEVPKKLVLEKHTECNELPVNSGTSNTRNKCSIVLAIAIIVSVLAVVAACVVFALEITKMKTEMSRLSAQMLSYNQALSEKLDKLTINSEMASQQAVNNVSERLNNVSEKLSNVTVQVTQDYSNRIQQLAFSSNTSLQQLNENFTNLSTSLQQLNENISAFAIESALIRQSHCAASLHPSSPSGYYWIKHVGRVYCNMTCGNIAGGWRRVAELDMTNSSHQCPSGLRQRNDSNLRTCGSPSTGCFSVMFSTSSINYTSVCGRVIGYQYGSPDSFDIIFPGSHFVDGIIVTHGSPREHIWTFAAARDEISRGCPCINVGTVDIPMFVGIDYFCDTGSRDHYQLGVFYSADPLWDGAGCGNNSTCCSFNNPPWFYKQLPQPTTDDIEMRVCRDTERSDEDIAIDLYVR